MKITDVEVVSLPHRGGCACLAVVHTDEDVIGVGESGMPGRSSVVRAALYDIREVVVGQDPTRIDHLWQLLYRGGFFPMLGAEGSALAAFDIALWDLRGKVLNVPVYDLLGGRSRDHVETYVHLVPGETSMVVESAQRAVAEGWRHLRLSVPTQGRTVDGRVAVRTALADFAAVRDAVGADIELIVDVHTRLDPCDALSLCRELEPLRPYFVEDPLRSDHLDGYRMLRARTAVPLAAGEQFTTKWQFAPLLENELIDHARVDVGNTGITEARKIAAMAEAHQIRLATHSASGPVAAAAALHLNLAVPNVSVQEHTYRPDTDAVTSHPTSPVGSATPPGSGLGVRVDLDAVRRLSCQHPPPPLLRRPDGSFTGW